MLWKFEDLQQSMVKPRSTHQTCGILGLQISPGIKHFVCEHMDTSVALSPTTMQAFHWCNLASTEMTLLRVSFQHWEMHTEKILRTCTSGNHTSLKLGFKLAWRCAVLLKAARKHVVLTTCFKRGVLLEMDGGRDKGQVKWTSLC